MSIAAVSVGGAVASAPVQATHVSRARFGDVLRQAAQPAGAPAAHSFPVRVLEHVERAQRRLDDLLAQARAGRTFSGAELLALQGEAYRFSHTVELASKVVEQGAQTVKQAVNTAV